MGFHCHHQHYCHHHNHYQWDVNIIIVIITILESIDITILTIEGGCMGSIEPLAYTYASLFGIVKEDDYPYAR